MSFQVCEAILSDFNNGVNMLNSVLWRPIVLWVLPNIFEERTVSIFKSDTVSLPRKPQTNCYCPKNLKPVSVAARSEA
jgi:hypothetical protein